MLERRPLKARQLSGIIKQQGRTNFEKVWQAQFTYKSSNKLFRYLDYNLPSPSSAATLDDHIYSTQLIQSEALATAYRAWKRQWKGPGRESCGGLLA
jgi:hypothetical protein